LRQCNGIRQPDERAAQTCRCRRGAYDLFQCHHVRPAQFVGLTSRCPVRHCAAERLYDIVHADRGEPGIRPRKRQKAT